MKEKRVILRKSKAGSIEWRDFIKGLIVSVLSSVLAFFYELLQTEGFDFSQIEWNTVYVVAATAAIGYILKNLSSNSADQPFKNEKSARRKIEKEKLKAI